jgi:hypothetical protein
MAVTGVWGGLGGSSQPMSAVEAVASSALMRVGRKVRIAPPGSRVFLGGFPRVSSAVPAGCTPGYFLAVRPGRRRGEFGRVRNTVAVAMRGAFRDERPYRDH